jgi:hypothetical protein
VELIEDSLGLGLRLFDRKAVLAELRPDIRAVSLEVNSLVRPALCPVGKLPRRLDIARGGRLSNRLRNLASVRAAAAVPWIPFGKLLPHSLAQERRNRPASRVAALAWLKSRGIAFSEAAVIVSTAVVPLHISGWISWIIHG